MDAFQTISIIFSPYHVGLRDHRVGNEIQNLGVSVEFVEIEPVDDYEGEIGRRFEVMRRISKAISNSVTKDLAFIYFDAYDDLDSPDVNENGYLDAMGLSMLRGESWKTLMRPVPGFEPFDLSRFLYCGLQDQSSIQRQRVIDAGMHSIWGGTERKVDFATEPKTQLEQRSYSPALVHLDLDVLDDSYGKVNDFPSPGGLLESDLVSCMELVPKMTTPKSLTVCSFDLDAGDGDKIARIAIRAITIFVKSLLSEGALLKV
ncbi:arginase family protein [Aspergillus alliaceus]|uniref:arginase family protein n=1 Tax=Petromyces alliaceus TaxID=209559 RepID=UPI0012A6B9B3|nr:arginase [Aspergillus alliaceus]KAB8238592.1 arginase [Aspergillus alliaceus]